MALYRYADDTQIIRQIGEAEDTMNEMTAYLNTHPEIDRVVLLVGEEYGYEQLAEFVRDGNVRNLVLVSSFASEKLAELKRKLDYEHFLGNTNIPEQFEYVDVYSFHGLDGNWALCADWVESQVLLACRKWNPTILLTMLWEAQVSAFRLWEAYRECCTYILIKTLRWNKEPQILAWEKREGNNVELSIVFPMYNIADYLEQCIKSVTAWKAPYVEFLFVNDESPDNSREIVLKWAEKDSRIKLLDKKNGGCASARQHGLEHAKGRYIGLVDPDDFVDETMFRKLFASAMTGSYDISYCGYNEFYEDLGTTKQVADALGEPYCDGASDQRKIWELINWSRVAIWRGIYRADMLKEKGIHFYTDIKRYDDLPFKVEVFAAARSVIALQEHLYYYRLSRPGQDVSADDERLYVHFDIFKHLNESIASKRNARLTDHLQICKIQTHLWVLEKIKPELRKEYIERAREDLNSTGDFDRTYRLTKEMIGLENANAYRAIIDGRVN